MILINLLRRSLCVSFLYTFRVMLTTRVHFNVFSEQSVDGSVCIGALVVDRAKEMKYVQTFGVVILLTPSLRPHAPNHFSTVTEKFRAKNPTIQKLYRIDFSFRCPFFLDSGTFETATTKGLQR